MQVQLNLIKKKNSERKHTKVNEEINLNELFEEESKTIDKSSEKKKNKLIAESEKEKHSKRKKKKDKNSVAYKAKSIVLKSVVPSVATGLLCFVVGAVMFSSDDSSTKKVMSAQTIKKTNKALEKADAVKDTQIESLKRQLAQLTTLDTDGQKTLTADGKEPNNLAFVSDVNSAVTSNLEEFFTKVLAISPTANDSEIQTLRSDLSQYFTAEASASTLYSFLTGGSSAKELGEKTVKIGSPTVTLASSESSDSRRYLVVAPFAALNSEKIYNAFYVVQMTGDYKISDVKYAGYSDSIYTKVPHQLYKSEEEVNNIKAPAPVSQETKSSETESSSEEKK